MIRLFGSDECFECREVISFLKKNHILYFYVDAMFDDFDIDALCERYNVDELPHIQKLDGNNEVIEEGIGFEQTMKILKNLI